MEKITKIVPDTSVIIENLLSERIENKKLKVQEIIIHEAVLGELEHQANVGKAIGYLGLDEINKLRELSKKEKFLLSYKGSRPGASEIKHASLGEIDALIRDLALKEEATLITGDKVQSRVAEAKGMNVLYIEPIIKKKKLQLEKFFDQTTMSVHLKENNHPYAKKGVPGKWEFVKLNNKRLKPETLMDMSKEIVEEAKQRLDGYIEYDRRGTTIAQINNFRIVITRPPLSDGYEITAVRPVKKLNIEDYKLSEKLRKRIFTQAEGILIAGSPGEGKSTFTSALAEFYASLNKIVKTIESPRDLQLNPEITQYALSHANQQEIHDILLLSRPDYTVFDEMRNREDFMLFADLRLAGIGLAGVVHATNPVDAIQRFLGKTELGLIPQIIDTVIFIKAGQVFKALSLKMLVKVPSGMMEEDLARPVVEIKDFETGNLEYEIYSYGDQTTIVPVTVKKETPVQKLASQQIQKSLENFIPGVRAELVSNHRANVFVPEALIPRLIGKKGETIKELEKKLGISINVMNLENIPKEEGESLKYEISETKKSVVFHLDSRYTGKIVSGYSNEMYLFSSTVGRNGDLKINKKGKLGKNISSILNSNQEIELRL